MADKPSRRLGELVVVGAPREWAVEVKAFVPSRWSPVGLCSRLISTELAAKIRTHFRARSAPSPLKLSKYRPKVQFCAIARRQIMYIESPPMSQLEGKCHSQIRTPERLRTQRLAEPT